MLELQRVSIARQRLVGTAVEHALAHPPHKLPAAVVEAGEPVVKATHALAPSPDPNMPVIDRATDKVVAAIGKILDGFAALAVDDLVEPSSDVRTLAQAGDALRSEILPSGTGFVTARASVEWNALTDMVKASQSTTAQAAIKALHLAPAMAHLEKHVALYGRALGIGGTSSSAGAQDDGGASSDAWHNAFTAFAIQVEAHVRDRATRAALLGTYESQLEAQRAELRAAYRNRNKPQTAPGGSASNK